MDRSFHPVSPGEVTPAWLSGVLRPTGLLGDAQIAGVAIEIIGEERGFTGVIARLTLAYAGGADGAPETVVAKFPFAERGVDSSYRRVQAAASDASRVMAERAAREVAFYQAAGADLPQLPRCYFGYADVEAGEALLLLEDLAAGKPGDALAGCSVEEARSVLIAMRDVHARWWRDPALPSYGWLTDWFATSSRRAARYRAQVDEVIAAYGDRLGAQTVALLRGLVDPFEQILAALAAAPETVIHTDLHLDNVMFVQEGGVYQAKIIDWQSPSRGPAMLDVAGFIAESLSIDDRRASERELLREYHAGLLAAGIDGYPFEALFADYQWGLCVRMTGQVGWLARVVDAEPAGRERELVDAILDLGNVFAAVLDHDVVARIHT